jgi:hypothetical protein
VAAWGLFEKRDIQTLNRVASARTMDGYKIRAKLAINFPRPVTSAEAEQVMMQYARAFASAVECELSNGELPYEEHELLRRITDQVSALPRTHVRLIGLHVWHKGAISSGSMLAVQSAQTKPTVAAMPAVSQTRERASPESAQQAAVTTRPPDSASLTVPAPPTARGPSAPSSVSSARLQMPPLRAPTASMVAARGTRSEPGASGPSTGASHTSSVNLPALGASFPAAARMVSGVVPAVDPRILRAKSGFTVALEVSAAQTGEAVGRALAQPVRDAAASVLFATLDALCEAISDPLAILDGRVDPELRRGLVGEACVCVCYVLYESLTRTSLPQMLAIEVVQGACIEALMGEAMPVSEISRYLATESPREEFSARVCTLLKVRENAELQKRIESSLRALRLDVRSCSEQIEQRLTRNKALTGQKTA